MGDFVTVPDERFADSELVYHCKAIAAFDVVIAANNAATRVEDIKFVDSMGGAKIADLNQKTLNEHMELDARSRDAVHEHLAAALADTCQENAR
jgi:hypothetical protein